MKKLFTFIQQNFGISLLFFSLFAFFFPQFFLWGENLVDEMLMFALFLGCLKINFSEIFHLKENKWKMLLFVFISVVLLPSIFFFLTSWMDEDVRLGYFLLMAVSAAVVNPIVASILHLKILWSTAFVVLTSAVLPFVFPFLLFFFFGISIDLSPWEMSMFLAKMIFIPAALAFIVRRFFPEKIKKTLPFTGIVGTINMCIFIGILVAINQAELAASLFQFSTLPIVFGLCVLFCFRFFLGFFLPFSDNKERWTNSLMFGNMNNGIIILLAAKFFSPAVLMVVILSEIPWILAQPIFQTLLKKYS
jgi:predicted Na+-dependent transporter